MTGGLRSRESGRGTRSAGFLPADTLAGFLIAILAVVLIALFTYRSLVTRSITATRITQTLDAVQRLEELLSSVKDAETGERGFLLTGDERYLEPYTTGRAALGGAFTSLRSQLSTDAEQQQRVAALQQLADDWMALSAETVAMRRAGSTEAATDVARSDRAKAGMDRIRSLVAAMEDAERAVLAARQEEWQQAVIFSSRVTWGGSVVLLVLIAGAAVTASRQYRAREKEMWIRAGQTDLSDRLRGEQRLDSLGEKILAFLAEYLNALVGAIYIRDRAGTFRRFASHALSPANADDVVRPGDGLLGQAAKDNRPLRVRTCRTATSPSRRAWATGSRSNSSSLRPAWMASSTRCSSSGSFIECCRRIWSCSSASPNRSASPSDRRRTGRGSRSCWRRRSGRPRSCRRSRRSCASATRSSRSRRTSLKRVAGAAREPAGRARADQLAAGGADRSCSRLRRTS